MKSPLDILMVMLFVINIEYNEGAAPLLPRCLENNRIAWRKWPPYTEQINSTYIGIVEEIFQEGMRSCCNGKLTYNRSTIFNSQGDVTDILEDTNTGQMVEFILPIQREITSKTFLIYPFVPMVVSPGHALFIKQKDVGTLAIVNAINDIVPFILLMIICVGSAGIFYWMLENMTLAWYGETPERFNPGIINGIWWAYVTMTTVGYGDQVPKTKPGRIFSILWVIVGISFCGVFMSTITSSLILSLTRKDIELMNKAVAVLRGSEEYRYAFQKQGIPFQYDSVHEIATALNEETVSLALIDVMTAAYYEEELKGFILDRIIETMTSNGVIFVHKGMKYATCVRNYIFDSQDKILNKVSETVKVITYKSYEKTTTSNIMNPSLPTFRMFLLTMVVTLLFFIFCGVLKQWIEKKKSSKEKSSGNHLSDREQLIDRNNYRHELIHIINDIKTTCESFIRDLEEDNRDM